MNAENQRRDGGSQEQGLNPQGFQFAAEGQPLNPGEVPDNIFLAQAGGRTAQRPTSGSGGIRMPGGESHGRLPNGVKIAAAAAITLVGGEAVGELTGYGISNLFTNDSSATQRIDAPTQPTAIPGTNIENPLASPVATVEMGRKLFQPAEIAEIPQSLRDALRKEDSEHTEVLHMYQGRYFQFGFAIDDRLPTRTPETTDYGRAKFKDGSVTTLSDINITTREVDEYSDVEITEADIIQRMENVYVLRMISEYRQDDNYKDLFPEFDPQNDPYDLKALETFDRHYKDGTLKAGMVNGFFIDPTKPRLIKLEHDNPGRTIVNGFGYGIQYIQNGEYKSSELFRLWFQGAKDRDHQLALLRELVGKGEITQEQVDEGLKMVGPGWSQELVNNFLSGFVASTNPHIQQVFDSGKSPDIRQLADAFEPYEYQLYPVVKSDKYKVGIMQLTN